MRQINRIEAHVLAAFATAAIVVLLLLALTWKLARDATRAAGGVAQTHEVISHLAHVRTGTVQIELSTQNFRITGNAVHLVERDRYIATREMQLTRIAALTDDPTQRDRWSRLRQVIDERLVISRRVEELRKTQGAEAATAYAAAAPLQQTRARTYAILDAMDLVEQAHLASRNAQQADARQNTVAAGGAASVLLLALLAATYLVIRRQLVERQEQQHRLAQSEEDLSTTLLSIGDAVIATDVEGRVTRMNPVAEKLTGWTIQEARGRGIDAVFVIVNEQSGLPAEIPVAHVIAHGVIVELANHTVLVARDGSRCPIADSAAPIRDASGQVRGVVIVFRDETSARTLQRDVENQNLLLEQRVQERTGLLRESEGHLKSIINSVPALFAYVDAQQRYVYVNTQYRQRYPDGPDIVGRSVREVLGEDLFTAVSARIATVLAGQEVRFDWQPSTDVWQAIQYLPSVTEDGEVTGYYILGMDITERRRAEQALRDNEQQLQRVLDGSDQGYWDWDLPSNKFHVSARWESMLGYTPGEMRLDKAQWDELVHPDDLAPARDSMQRHLSGQTPHHHAEFRARTKQGAWIWIATRGRVVARAADGTPTIVSGTHTDITTRRHAQDALAEALKDKEALLREVHHRVKNNLQVIASLLRLEGARSTLPHTRSVLDDMQGRIHTMALLHQSLYRSGTFASIDLGDYLRQLATQAFQTQVPRGSVIRLQLNLAPLRVAMDDALPCGLLVNELVSNCLKHAFPESAKGAVSVDLLAEDGDSHWLLRVSDTGCGLPDDLDRDNPNTLGLQLVRDLARQVDGTLDVTSAMGTGTRFTVRFTPAKLVEHGPERAVDEARAAPAMTRTPSPSYAATVPGP